MASLWTAVREFSTSTGEIEPMTDADLVDFVKCYNPENRYERTETWSEDNPDELAADIIENLQSALESFQELQAQLKK